MSDNRHTLRNNLTFEEFSALACRQPDLNGDWVYRLESYCFDDDTKVPYPQFKIWINEKRLFHTFAEAESCLQAYIIQQIDEPVDFYCHCITQVPIGVSEGEIGSQWLYDPYGKLIDYSISCWTGDAEHYHFFGRPDDRIRFRKGDIVEVRYSDIVKLAIVVSHVSTIQDCWGIYQCCQECGEKFRYCQDPSDDQCVIIDGPGYEYHEHVSPLRLMEPRFWVDESLRHEMRVWLEKL